MITVTFNNLEEMMAFAKKLLGVKETEEVNPQVPVEDIHVVTTPVAQTNTAVVSSHTKNTTLVQTSTPKYSLDDLSRAGVSLMDMGKTNELITALANFGVATLPELPVEQYGAFATTLRQLGAQI